MQWLQGRGGDQMERETGGGDKKMKDRSGQQSWRSKNRGQMMAGAMGREERGSDGQRRRRRAERKRKWVILEGIIARVHPWCMKCLLISFYPPFCHLWPS